LCPVESNDTTTGHSFNVARSTTGAESLSFESAIAAAAVNSSSQSGGHLKGQRRAGGVVQFSLHSQTAPDSAILNRPLPLEQFFLSFALFLVEGKFIFLSVGHLLPPADAKEGGPRPPFFLQSRRFDSWEKTLSVLPI